LAIKAILFDLGGTLLHYFDPREGDPRLPFRRVTLLGIQTVLAQLAADGLIQLPEEAILKTIDEHIGRAYRAMQLSQRGGSIETPVRAALDEAGTVLDDAQWAGLRPLLYEPIDQIVSVRQGARATLDTLHGEGYQLGLISNTFWAADLHDRHLAEADLLDLLPMRVYSSSTPHQKPHPAIFLDTLEKMNIQPGEAAYVGDRADVDVAGAQHARMRGILIRSPYQSADLEHHAPDAIIEELPGLLPALARLQTFSPSSDDHPTE
jgi:HAD superfamily hydrolase (TIGR01549 family)